MSLPLRMRDVTRTYVADELVVALDRADLDVAAGSTTALLGPSGSGKSTVLTLLAGLQRPDSGEIHVGDAAVHLLPQRRLHALRAGTVAAVLQVPGAGLLPWASARDNLALVARRDDLLERLGLTAVADLPVARLSGGEQQRVALATAVAVEPQVLLLDEPTSQLDATSRAAVLALLDELREQRGTTVVVATHDDDVAQAADDLVRVRDGRLGP